MIVKCVSCHHEDQRVINDEPCDWCGDAMQSIGDDYMSVCDDSVTPHKRPMCIPDIDAGIPVDYVLDGIDSVLRNR